MSNLKIPAKVATASGKTPATDSSSRGRTCSKTSKHSVWRHFQAASCAVTWPEKKSHLTNFCHVVLFIIESKFGLPPHTEISSFVKRLERAYPFLVEHELYCYNRKHYKKLGKLFQKQSRDNRRYEIAPEAVIGSMSSGSNSNSKGSL